MKDDVSAFLLSYAPYQEEAALLTFLTSEGFMTLYDGYLMRRSYAFFRHQPEHLFVISYAPSPLNPEHYFLKSWEITQAHPLSSERLSLWQGLLGLARCCRQDYEHGPLLFRLYRRLGRLLSTPSIPLEKIYFSVAYLFLQALSLSGGGDFSYHYAQIWGRLKSSESFHKDFLHEGSIAPQNFAVVLDYTAEHLAEIIPIQNLVPYFRLCLRSYPP